MKNFLKAVLVLQLLLSMAALWFSIQLFPQREELKGRTQKLENTIRQIAATVERSDEDQAFVSVPDDQLKTFRQLPDGPPPMDGILEQLTVAARNQLARLNETRHTLADTKSTLARTEDDLRSTRSDLAAARDTIRARDESIASLQNSLSDRDTSIRNMERAERELKERVELLQVAIDDLEIQKKNFIDQVAMLEQQVASLEAVVNPDADKSALSQGQLGVVLYASPEWNFVVLGFDPDNMATIAPRIEFLVHRADQLVGKVRVESIVDNMAIAEILDGWQRLPPQEGDHVML